MIIEMAHNFYVYLPDNWMVINIQDARHRIYAGYVQVKNYETEYPCFVFFAEKPVNEFQRADEEFIYEQICAICPGFEKVLAKQVRIYRNSAGEKIGSNMTDDRPYIEWHEFYDLTDERYATEEAIRSVIEQGNTPSSNHEYMGLKNHPYVNLE